MHKLLSLLALAAASLWSAPQPSAVIPPECDEVFLSFDHPDSGEDQCFHFWTCDNGSYGWAYTDQGLC